ncbi:MAG TPA: TolC family protein [Holophagaceae bacterium]|jgi:outer membrane protein|nr:TolC family protein [Holophagaceae bacterium]
MTRTLHPLALLIPFSLVAQTAPAAPQPDAGTVNLTLQDAIQTALKNNLQVSIAEQTRKLAKGQLLTAEGAYDWNLTGSVSDSKTQSAAFPGAPVGTNFQRNLTVGVAKPFDWGGLFNFKYAPSYYASSPSGSAAPYSGTLSATYSQNLLSGFGTTASSSNLIVARNGSKAADYQFKQSVIQLVATIETDYWNVVYTRENLQNIQEALKLAQKQLDENKIRVQVGTLAPIEVTQAEAQVALQEQNIITAEAAHANAKDVLIRALYPLEGRPSAIQATDEPAVKPLPIDEASAEQMAVDSRPEMKTAQLNLDSQKILAEAAKNHTLPTLNLSVGYVGGSSYADRLAPVNTDLTSGTYPGYNIGLTFAYPILNRAARGQKVQANANLRSSELSLRDEELQVRLDVRQAYRNLETSARAVAATEKTRQYQEQALDAEQKKFENGMSTNFLVLQQQTALTNARTAEIQARIGNANAVTALEQAMGHLLEARNLQIQ